jgi:hypothetical protein
MTTRPMGMPAEAGQAVIIVCDAEVSGVIRADRPNRGDSRQVRIYIEAQLRPDSGAVP